MYSIYFNNTKLGELSEIPSKKGIYHRKQYDMMITESFIILGHCNRIDPVPKTSSGIMFLSHRISSFRRFDNLYVLNIYHVDNIHIKEQITLYNDMELLTNSISSDALLYSSEEDLKQNIEKSIETFFSKKNKKPIHKSVIEKELDSMNKNIDNYHWYDHSKNLYVFFNSETIKITEGIIFEDPQKLCNLFCGKIIIHKNIIEFLTCAAKRHTVIMINEKNKKIKFMVYKIYDRGEMHIIMSPDLTFQRPFEERDKTFKMANELIDKLHDLFKKKIMAINQ